MYNSLLFLHTNSPVASQEKGQNTFLSLAFLTFSKYIVENMTLRNQYFVMSVTN